MAFALMQFPLAQRCTRPPKERPVEERLPDHTRRQTDAQQCCCRLYLELWDQPPRLQVQRVLVETQLPAHHLLVVQLKLNVTASRNMDLCLEGLHVLGISPVKKTCSSVFIRLLRTLEALNPGSWSRILVQYLTMPAALPLALA